MGLNDYCVAQFLSATEFDIPLVYRAQCISSQMTDDLYPIFNQIYDKTGKKPVIALERAQGGANEMERFAHLNKGNKYKLYQMKRHGDADIYESQETLRLGWDTTSATRPKMLIALKECIDNKLIRIYDKATVEELFQFVKVQTSTIIKAQAERNCHDDCVMALAIVWQLYLDADNLVDEETAVAEAVSDYQRKIFELQNNQGTGGY